MAKPISKELYDALKAYSMPTTHAEYHGVQLNLWIEDCPVIASHGFGNTIQVLDNYREIANVDGTIRRISTGQREYCIRFTLNLTDVKDVNQTWYQKLNYGAYGVPVPTKLKFALIGTPIEPVTLRGPLRLETVHTFGPEAAHLLDFEFVGSPPIPYSESEIAVPENSDIYADDLVNQTPPATIELSPSPSIELSPSIEDPNWSDSPTDSYSFSPTASGSPGADLSSHEPPGEDEEDEEGPSLAERAELMQFELKKLMEQMEKKGIQQQKRKVSFN